MCWKGRVPQSHYEFRRAIVLSKMDPLRYLPRQLTAKSQMSKFSCKNMKRGTSARSKRKSTSSEATMTRAKRQHESILLKRSVYVTDGALSLNGALNIRLSREVPHMFDPVPKEDVGGKSCQLCRWAAGVKLMSQLVKCEDCSIILCTSCWRPFHTVEDLGEVKSELAAAVMERKKGMEKGAAKND